MMDRDYFQKLLRYLDRKGPSKNSRSRDQTQFSSRSTHNTTTHIHHHHTNYHSLTPDPWYIRCNYAWAAWDPFWGPYNYWSWSPSPVYQTINHYHMTGNQKSDEEEKREKKDGITGKKIVTGLIFAGTVIGTSYYLANSFLDYLEEQHLLDKLKTRDHSYPILCKAAKPVLETNLNYSRSILFSKFVVAGSGLALLADIFWFNDVPFMYLMMASGSFGIIYGLINHLIYARCDFNDEMKVIEREIERVLNSDSMPPATNPEHDMNASAPPHQEDELDSDDSTFDQEQNPKQQTSIYPYIPNLLDEDYHCSDQQ